MTTALRRRLDSLRRLAERPGTEGERLAAEAALGRILRRLGEPAPIQAPTNRKTTQRPRERPVEHPLRVGDVIDCPDREGTWRRCRCGSSRFMVEPGQFGHVAQLRCVECAREGRWLRAEHFMRGGRRRQ